MSGTKVILLRSTDTGAPVLSGTAGALVALLDACLQDGYNSKTPSGVTRTGSTATFTYATAHGYAADGLTKVLIAGADQAEYNGIFQISNVSTLSFDVTVTGTPATPATGTITTKAAPLGWSKAFSGTNKAAYRSNEVAGTKLYLRVDDTTDSGKSAGIRGYETMTDVDTGTGLFPTVAQLTPGIILTKSSAVDNAARSWILVGDGFEFLLFIAAFPAIYENIYDSFHFGDIYPEMASDPYGCLIYGNAILATYVGGGGNFTGKVLKLNTTQPGHYFARGYSQAGTAIGAGKLGNYAACGDTYPMGSDDAGLMAYPAPHNNGFYVSPVFACDGAVLRGQIKGLWQPLHIRPLGHAGLLAVNESPINRRLFSIKISYSASSSPGEVCLDIDGPWR